MSRCLACGRDPLPRNLSPVRHAGQRPAGDRKRRFQACSSPFLATLMPAPVAASTRARPWPLPVCRTCPARGPGPAARDCIKPQRRRLRDDISTIKTTYRLLRLATMLLLLQTAWPTRDATLPALLAQFLPDGFCAHWEPAGCTTREGTAHRQPGRLTGSGSERRFVSRWPSAQRGQSPGDAVGTGTGREDARRAMTRLWLPPSG